MNKLVCFLIVLTTSFSLLSEGAEIKSIASKEDGWPQWRGPRRDGVSTETGLLKSWPEKGPKLLWTAKGIDKGYSSPIITGDTIYITGDHDKEQRIYALDLDGKKKWETTNGQSWTKSWPGSRGSCTYSEGEIFQMNAHGRVVCLDAENGE